MGMHQAVREGKWINRPKTGYDLIDGELVANEMAPAVRRIFTVRGEGASQGEIADATAIKYSTVLSILHSRFYLGEVLLTGEWFPGQHEALIIPETFAATRQKLLRLYYDDRIGADLFAEEEARIGRAMEAVNGETEAARLELGKADDVQQRFEEVARVLEDLDIERSWVAATDLETASSSKSSSRR